MERFIFIKKYWREISFNTLIILVFAIFYGRFGDINVDSFREAYIPSQILSGECLYKDIFTIYAPFSYLFNSLLFTIFGTNLKILYFAGLISTLGIANITYKISNLFLEKNYSFGIILFFIASAIVSPNVFNTFFPYSYGILYGLLFILFSIYFALKEKFPLAYLFYSLAICSKYEFLLLLPLLIWSSKKQKLLQNFIALITPILFSLGIVLLQGTKISDLITSAQLILIMSSCETLKWFYSIMGYVFRLEHIPLYLINITKLAIPICVLHFFKQKWTYPIIFIYLALVLSPICLIFAFPLITILLIIRYRNLGNKERFFIFASLLISLKVFFALTLQAYGIFFIPLAMVSLFILCPQKLHRATFLTILFSATILGITNIQGLCEKNYVLKTENGIIKTYPHSGKSYDKMITYISQNIPQDSKILVYPEGLILNFMTNRKSDNKFYSLIPLYTETFGEEIIIKRIELEKPEYIIITDYNTSNYYFAHFGEDYAIKIKDYIRKHYTEVLKNNDGMGFSIYKIIQ